MKPNPEEHERRGSYWKWAAFFVALQVLYVLSVGPAYGLLTRDWDTFIAFNDEYLAVYRPLRWLASHTETHDLLESYRELWASWI